MRTRRADLHTPHPFFRDIWHRGARHSMRPPPGWISSIRLWNIPGVKLAETLERLKKTSVEIDTYPCDPPKSSNNSRSRVTYFFRNGNTSTQIAHFSVSRREWVRGGVHFICNGVYNFISKGSRPCSNVRLAIFARFPRASRVAVRLRIVT